MKSVTQQGETWGKLHFRILPLSRFQLNVESIPGSYYFCFNVLWLFKKIRTTFPNQSGVKIKPTTALSPTFSRASGIVFPPKMTSHWLLAIFFLMFLLAVEAMLFWSYDTESKNALSEPREYKAKICTLPPLSWAKVISTLLKEKKK